MSQSDSETTAGPALLEAVESVLTSKLPEALDPIAKRVEALENAPTLATDPITQEIIRVIQRMVPHEASGLVAMLKAATPPVPAA